jgi:hypothetical protein
MKRKTTVEKMREEAWNTTSTLKKQVKRSTTLPEDNRIRKDMGNDEKGEVGGGDGGTRLEATTNDVTRRSEAI